MGSCFGPLRRRRAADSRVTCIDRRQIVDVRAASGLGESAGEDLSKHRGSLAGKQIEEATDACAVFVAKGSVVKEVFDGLDATRSQQFGSCGADTLHVLNLRRER